MNKHKVTILISSSPLEGVLFWITGRPIRVEVDTMLSAEELGSEIKTLLAGLGAVKGNGKKYRFSEPGAILIVQWRDGKIDVEMEKGGLYRDYKNISRASMFRLLDLFRASDTTCDTMTSGPEKIGAWFTSFEFDKECSDGD